jgi:hypothetical protein
MRPTLIAPTGGKGGVGKTLACVQLTDYLKNKGYQVAAIDCDAENVNVGGSFTHWLGGNATAMNLRSAKDRDRLLEDSASCGAQFVVADLPGNSSGDLTEWLRRVATIKALEMLQLNVIALGCVTHEAESAASVAKWVTALGDRAHYLIVLNRKGLEVVTEPLEETFREWYRTVQPFLVPGVVRAERVHVVEMTHVPAHVMEQLKAQGKLPTYAIKETKLPVLSRIQAQSWRDEFHDQLDQTGLFAKESESKGAAQGA